MPVKVKTQTLDTIKKRIEEARRILRSEPWYETAERMKKLYAGYHWTEHDIDADALRDIITVNFAQSNVDIRVTAITASVPEFVIIPKEPSAVTTAVYQKQALQDVWDEIGAQTAVRQALKDSDITGMGVCFVGWRFETSKIMPYEGEKSPQETEEIVIWDNPIVRRVSPLAFVVDPAHPDIENIHDAQWIVEVKWVPLGVIKQDPRLKNTNKLKGSGQRQDMPEDITATEDKTTEKYVKIYDYWQKEDRIHAIIADELPDEPLLTEAFPYPFPSYPYEVIVERWIPDSRYPQGVLQPAEALIKLLDKYRTLQIRHDARFAKGAVIVNDTVMSEEESERLQYGEDGCILHAHDAPQAALAPIMFPPLPQSFYATMAELADDINLIMGVNEYRQGTPDRTRRTLGEVQSIISLSASRAQYKQLVFEEFCARIGKKILLLLQDPRFCDRIRFMRMTGASEEELEEWNYERVLGDSDVKVVTDSTRPPTQDQEVQRWGFLLQSLTPYMQMGLVNIAPILQEVLKASGIPPSKIKEIQQSQESPIIMQLMQAVQALAMQVQQIQQALGQQAQAGTDIQREKLELERQRLNADIEARAAEIAERIMRGS